jgi:hypothetical protein
VYFPDDFNFSSVASEIKNIMGKTCFWPQQMK